MKISKVNVDSPLHCPHDLSKSNEFRDDLPVILDKTLLNNKNDDVKLEIEAENSIYSVFNTVEAMLTDNEIEDKLKSIKFLGPFERYKLVRPYLEEQEKKEEAKRLKEAEERSKNSENPQEQIIERTDEDRIETIRQHFLSLSRCELPTAGESTLDKSLIHMGGSKKRKRSPSRQFDEDATSSSENVHTLPNVNRKANKRKSSEVQEGTNSKIKKHYDKSDPSSNRTSPHIRDNNQGKQTGNRKQNKNNYRNRNRQNKNKKTNPSQNEANECTTQNQESFQPYDYSSVDFQQFQGGAGQSRGQKTFKSKFKPRWKKKGNKGNKSETFGNVKKGTEYGR